ncbi:MAG: GNAT family N-acetyltransferase [Alphaproteobacteria bacterium]|nr:GNAT family N-acetyltransferase [Alphaproteobacteria bacterium]OJV14095.1 MAG: GNAT family N-acetyltransferase [Alphaproteobacteria bacterium 33-17]
MITIELLKNRLDSLPRLCEIWHTELGSTWAPDTPIEDIIERFKTHLNDDQIPLTYVAFDNNIPIGMCSLREKDGTLRQDLSPCLGSLVVDKQYQGKGIGKMLMEKVINKAKSMNYKTLYLFAIGEGKYKYYENSGWESVCDDEFKNIPVKVMKMDL